MTRAVGLTRDLPNGRVMRAEVSGMDLAVWRNQQGEIAAWNNRCPHRGMRLSHGFVRGDRLACLYHGWQYDASGRCRYIPAHPDLAPPETIHTTAVSVVEQGGVIWVSTEGPVSPPAIADGLAPLRSLICPASSEPLDAQPGQPTDLTLFCNPLASGETLVVALVEAGADLARQKWLSRWCETLRREAAPA